MWSVKCRGCELVVYGHFRQVQVGNRFFILVIIINYRLPEVIIPVFI